LDNKNIQPLVLIHSQYQKKFIQFLLLQLVVALVLTGVTAVVVAVLDTRTTSL
jgi:hypothetical protein